MRFIGSLKFYSNFNDELHVNMKPLSELLKDFFLISRNKEVETLFEQIKTFITNVVTLTLPNTN